MLTNLCYYISLSPEPEARAKFWNKLNHEYDGHSNLADLQVLQTSIPNVARLSKCSEMEVAPS